MGTVAWKKADWRRWVSLLRFLRLDTYHLLPIRDMVNILLKWRSILKNHRTQPVDSPCNTWTDRWVFMFLATTPIDHGRSGSDILLGGPRQGTQIATLNVIIARTASQTANVLTYKIRRLNNMIYVIVRTVRVRFPIGTCTPRPIGVYLWLISVSLFAWS